MRIWYKTSKFATNKVVTIWFIKPDLIQTPLLTFTEWGEGFYYLDYDFDFRNKRTYVGKAFENGIPTIAQIFRGGSCPGIVTKV